MYETAELIWIGSYSRRKRFLVVIETAHVAKSPQAIGSKHRCQT